MRTLYLCYFGLREPLVQTQVLPYLRELRRGGIGVGLLTFEPVRQSGWPPDEVQGWRERLRAEGIDWYSMAYHKRPSLPATAYDIAVGGWAAARLVRRHGYDVVHGRAHVATAIGLVAKRLTGCRLVFDIRGFNPEEYVDAGVWAPGGFKFRLAKRVEKRLLAAADAFVVLTERARDLLFPDCSDTDDAGRPVQVIPCCVDLGRFEAFADLDRGTVRRELGVAKRRVLVYVGALGGFYLTDEMAEMIAFAYRRDRSTFAMILTQSPPERIEREFAKLRLPASAYLVRHVAPYDVPRYLRAADLAVSFIKPTYSKQASSPTKIAEYLAGGLPVVCNAGVGDLDGLIEGDRVGSLVRGFRTDDFARALGEAEELMKDPGLTARCRASATERFALREVGGARYVDLYRRLVGAPRIETTPTGSRP